MHAVPRVILVNALHLFVEAQQFERMFCSTWTAMGEALQRRTFVVVLLSLRTVRYKILKNDGFADHIYGESSLLKYPVSKDPI